jgi:hypothetical protein
MLLCKIPFSSHFVNVWQLCFFGRQPHIHLFVHSMFLPHSDIITYVNCVMKLHDMTSLIKQNVKKNYIYWDVTPCSPLNVNRCFGVTSPPSSGSKNRRARNQHEGRWQAERWFLARLILRPWRWKRQSSYVTWFTVHIWMPDDDLYIGRNM